MHGDIIAMKIQNIFTLYCHYCNCLFIILIVILSDDSYCINTVIHWKSFFLLQNLLES